MKSHARVVVIGGGVVGVSALYHLAKKGWSDVVLVERKELTSGSTWHAAGLLPLFNMSYSVGQIHKYSVKFYQELQKETGMNVGFRNVSNIRLAQTQERMDEYRQYAGVASTIGVQVDFLTPEQVQEIWPLCNPDGLVGAIQHPDDGYIQPADLTQAMARGARDRGAEIYRNTTVTGISRTASGEWKVTTDKGEITCEHIISASGNFARKTGRMVGLNLPVIPVEHQYIVTEPHDAIRERQAQGLPEMGVLRDSDGRWYLREEAGGLILGPYEKGAPACYVDGPSDESEYELFQEDLERLMPHIESAMHRVPAFGEVGVKKVYNGAIAYTPDGAPGRTSWVKAIPLIASASVCASVPATDTGDIAPARMNGAVITAWLCRAYTFSAPSITESHVIGEFALIRLIDTVLFSTNSSPNRIFDMSTVSCARSGAVTDPI